MPEPHERLNEAMNERRLELRMNWREVAQAAQISYEALRAIRRGGYRPTELTARGVDEALRWASGSVYAILAGGEPIPAEPPEAVQPLPEPLAGLEVWRQRTILEMVAQLPAERRGPALRRLAERVEAGELGLAEEPGESGGEQRSGQTG
jgi:hypothetical protein